MFRIYSLICVLVASIISFAVTAKTLTIVSWGGAYEESQRRAYTEPFTAQNPDVDFIWEAKSNNALANLRAQIEADNVIWDVIDVIPDYAQVACDEGLIEPIDHDTMLAKGSDGSLPTEDFLDGSLSECFVPNIVYSNVFAYSTEVYSDPNSRPRTIVDLFDLKRFPGKRTFQKTPLVIMEWALVADGVPLSEVYTVLDTREGVNRALAKMDTIKDSIIWWELAAQAVQLLADKEVVFASTYNGRIFNAQVNEKQPFEIVWDAQILEFDGWVIPKGKATPEVLAFVKFATDTQRLADQAKYISYGPARLSSAPFVSTHADTGVEMKPHMPTTPINAANAIVKDVAFWADNLDELTQVFNSWVNK